MAGLVLFAVLVYMASIRIYDWLNGYGDLF